MVFMKGTSRMFETPNVETSVSSTTRTVSIYGVTSYNSIINCIIPIKSMAGGYSGTNTININSLGTKYLKGYKNGIKTNLQDNWVSANQIYFIYYDGTDFIVFNSNIPADSASSSAYIFSTEDSTDLFVTYANADGLALSQQDIDNIIGGASLEQDFMDAITNNKFMVYLYDNGSENYLYQVTNIVYGTSHSFTIKNIDGMELDFQFDIVGGVYDSGTVTYVELNPLEISSNVLSLSTGATQQQILTAFGSADIEWNLIDALSKNRDIISLNNYATANPAVEQYEYIHFINSKRDFVDGLYDDIKLTYAEASGQLYNIVIGVDISNPTSPFISYSREPAAASITVENDLTSDSQVNPPSVHAINQALGDIDTILTNIIGS